jgi:hypothetical protein
MNRKTTWLALAGVALCLVGILLGGHRPARTPEEREAPSPTTSNHTRPRLKGPMPRYIEITPESARANRAARRARGEFVIGDGTRP